MGRDKMKRGAMLLMCAVPFMHAEVRYDCNNEKYYTYPYDEKVDAEEYDAIARLAFAQLQITITDDFDDFDDAELFVTKKGWFARHIVKNISQIVKKIHTYTAHRFADDIHAFESNSLSYR
jgi:hypothetical protein